MVNYGAGTLDSTFAALSDPTRREILQRLSGGERAIGELAERFDISLPAVSKHLTVLQRAGLIVRRKQGRVRRCRLLARPMREAAAWIQRYRRFWEQQFDQLARYLEENPEEENALWPRPDSSRHPPTRSGSAGRSEPPGSGSSGRGRRRKK